MTDLRCRRYFSCKMAFIHAGFHQPSCFSAHPFLLQWDWVDYIVCIMTHRLVWWFIHHNPSTNKLYAPFSRWHKFGGDFLVPRIYNKVGFSIFLPEHTQNLPCSQNSLLNCIQGTRVYITFWCHLILSNTKHNLQQPSNYNDAILITVVSKQLPEVKQTYYNG